MLELGIKEVTLSKNELILHKIDRIIGLDLDLDRTIVYEKGKPVKATIKLESACIEIDNNLVVYVKGSYSFYITSDYVMKKIDANKKILRDEVFSYKDDNGFIYYNNSHGANLIKHIDYDDFYKLLKSIKEIEKDIKDCKDKLDLLRKDVKNFL